VRASRELFPSPTQDGRSLYEEALLQVLAARGLPVEGRAAADLLTPAAVDTAGAAFATTHPVMQAQQPFGAETVQTGSFSGAAGAATHAFQFHAFNRLGPCDHFEITNGTYDTNGVYVPTGDGTAFRHTFTDTELAAATLLLPGHRFSWKVVVARCPDDLRPDYRADVSPFGLRVVGAQADGFGVHVGGTVDGLTALRAEDGGAAAGRWQYTWRFRNLTQERDWTATGPVVLVEGLDEQGPVSLTLERTDGAATQTVRHFTLGGPGHRPRTLDLTWGAGAR
jgi:hypothetical protein